MYVEIGSNMFYLTFVMCNEVVITTFPIRERGKMDLHEKGTLKNLITSNCLREGQTNYSL